VVVGRKSHEVKPKSQGPDVWHSDNEFVHRVSHTLKIRSGLGPRQLTQLMIPSSKS
jgi:hypothetical protein